VPAASLDGVEILDAEGELFVHRAGVLQLGHVVDDKLQWRSRHPSRALPGTGGPGPPRRRSGAGPSKEVAQPA
jgi:hypothetical protein